MKANKPSAAATKRADAATSKARNDGWTNLLSGVGVPGVDRRTDTSYRPTARLVDSVLRDMYRGDGFARKIVDLPTKEMLRRGFEIEEGDPDALVQARFQEIGMHKKVGDLLRWSRLFGGALGVLGLKDGQQLDKELNERALQSVDFMHVFDRYRVQWTSSDLYRDPLNPKFGTPNIYTISPINGASFRVHESRTVIIDGIPVPDLDRTGNQGWGDSALQPCFDQLRSWAGVNSGAELIIEDFVQAVMSIKNLQEMLSTPEGSLLVKERLNLLDNSRHVLHMKLLDADGETYSKESSSVAGLAELMDRFAISLSGVTGIPATKLFGRTPAGLNATGESDIRNWYDDVHADQEAILTPVYERLCRLVFISKNGGFKGVEPEKWSIEWLPLWEPTEAEIAKTYLDLSNGDMNYATMGALDPTDIRGARFVGEGTAGIKVESATPPAPPPPPAPPAPPAPVPPV